MKNEPEKIVLIIRDADLKAKDFKDLDHEYTYWAETAPTGKDIEYVRAKSLNKVFKAVFEAGKKCMQDHPDDSTYDSIRFKEGVTKGLKKLK